MNSSWFWIMACRYDKCLNTNFSCKTHIIHVKFCNPLLMQVKMLWVSLDLKCLAQNIFTACKIQLASDHASECLVFWTLCVYVCMVLWQNVKNIILGTVDLEHLVIFDLEWPIFLSMSQLYIPRVWLKLWNKILQLYLCVKNKLWVHSDIIFLLILFNFQYSCSQYVISLQIWHLCIQLCSCWSKNIKNSTHDYEFLQL